MVIRKVKGFIAGHKKLTASVLVAGIALGTFGMLWFQPWKLFTNTTIDEALPIAGLGTARPTVTASPTPATTTTPTPTPAATPTKKATTPTPKPSTPPPAPAQPKTLSTGEFRSLEHETTGTAKIIELPDGRRIVRFENLDTSNGPDLVVLLSDTPATNDDWHAYDDGKTLLLGNLKANRGNQNYDIPAGTDLSEFRSVVVWCRRFTVGFGAAPVSAQ